MISSVIRSLDRCVFRNRPLVIGVFILLTVLMGISASRLRIDAGFDKMLPMKHDYMKVFARYRTVFGGANRVIVALVKRRGDIFTPEFFKALEKATDDVFFMPGVDRSRVSSLFTPNVTYAEVVEDGFVGGNIVPADFTPTAEKLDQVRKNVLASEYVGRLVANDFTGAIISAELMDIDPATGKKLDVVQTAKALERIRATYSNDDIDVHIIGFAKIVGDMAEGAARVVGFFGITLLVTAAMVFFYTLSVRRTLLPLACSLIAVVWQLGLLPVLGYGIDPMGILVPFLVFAIAVSHGVQMVSANRAEVFAGATPLDAARSSFRRLLVPGVIALASDTIGFVTIRLIEIRIIQEMATIASLGVLVIILTNMILLPVMLSYVGIGEASQKRLRARAARFGKVWQVLAALTRRRNAAVIIAIALVLFVFGLWKGTGIHIGDLHRGVPELRPDSRYNVDTRAITRKFAIGTDVITVYAEAGPDACIDYASMEAIDDFGWRLANLKGVHAVLSLPTVAKVITSGWNQGSLAWRVLSRNQDVLREAVQYVPTTTTGLLNRDCSVMPIYLFTRDHKADTISNIVATIKDYKEKTPNDKVTFSLAGGNVGVMAATNEEVVASQFPILLYVFGAVIALCLITYRSIRATFCIILPLGLVSLLGYALMTLLDIGLKVNTPAGGGPGCRGRRGLRHLYLQPPGKHYDGRQSAGGGLSGNPRHHRQRGGPDRGDPGHRCGDLDLLTAAVSGRYGDIADLSLFGEHARGRTPASGPGGLVAAAKTDDDVGFWYPLSRRKPRGRRLAWMENIMVLKIRTRLTEIYGIRYPIIGAPMFLVSYEALAIAVSEAGGMGTIPLPNYRGVDRLKEALEVIRRGTKKPIGVNIHLSGRFEWKAQLAVCLDAGVGFFITSLGDPKKIIDDVHANGGKVFPDVISLAQGLKSRDAGADGLVAVGAGAGGHGGTVPIPILVPYLVEKTGLPVIAAGGISTGAQMASAVAVGACGVIVGTRLIATLEARALPAYKAAVMAAGPDDIVFSDRITGNGANWIRQSIASVDHSPAIGSRKWRDIWSAGQSVAQVERICPAGEVVQEMARTYVETCAALQQTVREDEFSAQER